MKKLFIMLTMAIFLTFSVCIGISIGAEKPYGEVSAVNGSVSVEREGESLIATQGMALNETDMIKTGEDAFVTVTFNNEVSGTLKEGKVMKMSDFFFKTKMEASRMNIKRPETNEPAKIETVTIGGSRGTEEEEKKAKKLKNKHTWDENVDVDANADENESVNGD